MPLRETLKRLIARLSAHINIRETDGPELSVCEQTSLQIFRNLANQLFNL